MQRICFRRQWMLIMEAGSQMLKDWQTKQMRQHRKPVPRLQQGEQPKVPANNNSRSAVGALPPTPPSVAEADRERGEGEEELENHQDMGESLEETPIHQIPSTISDSQIDSS